MVEAKSIPLEQAAFQEAWELLKEAYDMQDIESNCFYRGQKLLKNSFPERSYRNCLRTSQSVSYVILKQ